ncbi:hypothetical protein RIF29_38056 [Crotalaria pallida]|uniref:Uncharacterized protein n=1 Tax=Crotalaria pallida TaxID=3830 RepID=A0AAN9DYX2_CROPI
MFISTSCVFYPASLLFDSKCHFLRFFLGLLCIHAPTLSLSLFLIFSLFLIATIHNQGRRESSPNLHHDPYLPPAQDLDRLLSEQRSELVAAEAMESGLDLDFALQEALAASPSSSTLPNLQQQQPLPDDAVFNPNALQLR